MSNPNNPSFPPDIELIYQKFGVPERCRPCIQMMLAATDFSMQVQAGTAMWGAAIARFFERVDADTMLTLPPHCQGAGPDIVSPARGGMPDAQRCNSPVPPPLPPLPGTQKP